MKTSFLYKTSCNSMPVANPGNRSMMTPCWSHRRRKLQRSMLTCTAKTGEDCGTTAPSLMPGHLQEERGVSFVTVNAFYRAESCAGRDLAVLAAALHRQRTGRLRVLDVMAASGMRGARYLVQAEADEVWVNDGSAELHDTMVYNMCAAAGLPPPAGPGASIAAAATAPLTGKTAVAAEAIAAADAGQEPSYNTALPAGNLAGRTLGECVAFWEGQAQRLRLEGLARDVWQWDVPRPLDHRTESAQPEPPEPAAAVPIAVAEGSAPGGLQCSSGDAAHVMGGCERQRSSTSRSTSTSSCSAPAAGETGVSESPPPATRRIRISHADANRLLTSCYMRESYYDLVDVDSFGSETMHFTAAIDAVRYGGLLYLTSTDGFTSSGKRPDRGLAAYGCYARSTPWANEQGLRMIIGAAVREAAARGVTLSPVFSLYSYHGPVFRVMLRAKRSAEWHAHHYGFMGHCFVHGDNYTVGWRDLGAATCRCERRGRRRGAEAAARSAADAGSTSSTSTAAEGGSGTGGGEAGAPVVPGGSSGMPGTDGRRLGDVRSEGTRVADVNGSGAEAGAGRSATPLVLSGPLWTGPLHDEEELRAMAAEAARRGWRGFGLDEAGTPHLRKRQKSSRNVRPLEELLEVLVEEADPRLPPGFFSIDDSVARRMARPPPRDALIAALREEGFAAARCHLEARAFRTDACMEDVLRVAEERLGIPRRR